VSSLEWVAVAPRAADEDAFSVLVESTYADLLRYAARRVGPDAAADVVADVFLVAWRRRDAMPADAARLWLFGVAHRVVANHLRGELRRERLAARLASEPPDPALGHPDGAADADVVRAALGRLRDSEQEALRLTEWEQLSIEEAAAVVGISRGAFRVRLHRARRRLAAELADTRSQDQHQNHPLGDPS